MRGVPKNGYNNKRHILRAIVLSRRNACHVHFVEAKCGRHGRGVSTIIFIKNQLYSTTTTTTISPRGCSVCMPTKGSIRRGLLPPLCGGIPQSQKLLVLPIPSSPAQCREETTFTWTSDDRRKLQRPGAACLATLGAILGCILGSLGIVFNQHIRGTLQGAF